MRNIKLTLEYDGTDFVGWQFQNNGRSVQGEILIALRQLLQEDVNVIGAGRTDSGVHARGQVANFRTDSAMAVREVHKALNALLPEDICIHSAEEVPAKFHARFDAVQRRYSYRISFVKTSIARRYCWFLGYDLDVNAMNRSASTILGEHNFKSFSKEVADLSHHRCTVHSSFWEHDEAGIRYHVASNRFLHGMVRTLVGTMVDVGRHRTSEEDFLAILASRDRSKAGMAASPRGLVLEEVLY